MAGKGLCELRLFNCGKCGQRHNIDGLYKYVHERGN